MNYKKNISILVPIYNEAETIPLFYHRLCKSLKPLEGHFSFSILFTNNASQDSSLSILHKLQLVDHRINYLTFSRNFGYQNALFAGLSFCSDEATFIIDVDCQDPPELLATFLKHFETADIVYGERVSRDEPFLIRSCRKLFYRFTRLIADERFLVDMGDFVLISRRAREAVLKTQTAFPFLRSELGFIGFKCFGIPYHRGKRVSGSSKFNWFRLFQFGWNGILSSSTLFLRLLGSVGFALASVNVLTGLASFFVSIDGFKTSLLFLDAVYLVTGVACLAAFINRQYLNSLQRPRFIVDWKNSSLNRITTENKKGSIDLSIEPS